MTDEKTNGKKVFKAGIMTPYLLESLDQLRSGETEEYVQAQIKKFGYDPNNLNGMKVIETPGHIVSIESPEHHTTQSPKDCDMIVIGCAGNCEDMVRSARNSGILFARYSVFYGGVSKYSNEMPEATGFSLDIPKRVDAVKAMLTHDELLEAIVTREEAKIVAALDSLNKKLTEPILATPYLKTALTYSKN
jgi:hypothetical protein